MATYTTRIGLVLGLVLLSGSAGAAGADQDICHRYSHALAVEAESAYSDAVSDDGVYDMAIEAYDDCLDSSLLSTLGSLTRISAVQSAQLIECPWGYDAEANPECQ